MMRWRELGIEIPYNRTSGNIKTYCPQCRDSRHNKRDKSLSVDLATGVFNCHYCGWAGCAVEKEQRWDKPFYNPRPLARQKPEYKKPKQTGNTAMSSKAIAWFAGRGISKKTLEQMRVTEGMEWMPQKNGQANTIQFNYYRRGELVNTKFRTGDKCFKMVSGAELLPYNIDAIKGQKECIITEGEMDALSFIECGRTDVVSVPNGANANLSYLDDYIEEYFLHKVTTKKRNAERYSDRIELQGFQSCFRLFVKPSQSPLKPNQDAATLLVRNHARNGDKRTRITKQGVKD